MPSQLSPRRERVDDVPQARRGRRGKPQAQTAGSARDCKGGWHNPPLRAPVRHGVGKKPKAGEGATVPKKLTKTANKPTAVGKPPE